MNHLSRGIVLGFCLTFTGGIAALATAACTPAQSAAWNTIESTVLVDVEAGKTPAQIETDVATIAVGKSGPELVLLVDDAITFLEDVGAFSILAQRRVAELHASLATQRAAELSAPGSLR